MAERSSGQHRDHKATRKESRTFDFKVFRLDIPSSRTFIFRTPPSAEVGCWGGNVRPTPRLALALADAAGRRPHRLDSHGGHVELGALGALGGARRRRLGLRARGWRPRGGASAVPRRSPVVRPPGRLPVRRFGPRRVRRHHVRAAPDEVPGDRDRDEPHGRGAGAARLVPHRADVVQRLRPRRLAEPPALVPRGALREDPANLLGRRGRVPGRRLRGPRRRRRRPQLRPDSLRGRDPGRRPLRRRRNRERRVFVLRPPSPLSSRTSAPGSARSRPSTSASPGTTPSATSRRSTAPRRSRRATRRA